MGLTFTDSARRVGVRAAYGFVFLSVIYAAVLAIGLYRLPSPDVPIAGVLFVILELLILVLAPTLVAVMIALHMWAAREDRVFSTLAIVFMSVLATITSGVHFVILAVSHHSAVRALSGASVLFSFRWPSVLYALDILAWDVFFPLGAWCASLVLRRDAPARLVSHLLRLSALLAFAGLSGVIANDMQWRNIGIIGYAVVFPLAVYRLGRLFARSAQHDPARDFMK